jgi:hypothetical protein
MIVEHDYKADRGNCEGWQAGVGLCGAEVVDVGENR